jgi:uncharacterized repeat protein (TIGR01451 family)
MKVRVLFSTLLVIVLLSSMLAPLAAAQEPTDTGAAPSLDDLEGMYEKGLITLQEYKEAAAGLAPASPGTVLVGGEPEAVFFAEDFETWPPPGWTIVDNGGTCVWESNTFWGRTNYAGGDGQCADADSDACGSGTTMDTELQSPLIDLSGAPPGVFLQFVGAYNDITTGGSDYAEVLVSPDGGTTWIQELYWDEDHSAYGPGEVVVIDMTPYVGSTDVVISFHYFAPTWDWYFEVDQVRVQSPSPDFGDSYKEVWPTKAVAGDVLTYTVQIINSGNAPALGAIMTDVIPAGTAYVPDSLDCSLGTCWYDDVDNAVYWSGELLPPASAELKGWQPEAPVAPEGNYDPAAVVDLVGGVEPAAPPAPEGTSLIWTYPEAVLWDNGPLVTHPGDCSGMDASRLQTGLAMNTLGFGHQFANGYRMADDFEIVDPGGWNIDQITFFAYQTNAPSSPSPITGVYYQIWDGPPDDPGSSVVFGDLVTNRLLSSASPNMQRDSESTPCANNRYVFADVASAGLWLPPGIYWLDWMTDGSPSYSGPWAPPITILGETTTGNALQYTTAWAPANDSGTLTQQGMPFIIEGAAVAPNETMVTFQVEVVDAPCGMPVVNEAVIYDPEAAPVVVQAFTEIWDTVWLHEEFEGTFPPAGWAVNDYGGSGAPGSVWTETDPGGRGNLTGGSGLFAIADSDAAGSGVLVETDMWLPPIDIPTCQDVFLVFKTDYYNISANETAAVDISLDGGGTWENLLLWNYSVRGPHTEWVPLGDYAGAMGAILRFYYNDAGNWAWWWEVDDVQIVSCVKEGVFLTPDYQSATGCPGEVMGYTLSVENCTGMDETFNLYPMDNDWATWVEPGMVEVPDTGIVDVMAYVQSPCDADGSDLATIVAADGGYSDTAEIESFASEGGWVWNAENADMVPMPDTLWGSGDGIVMDGDMPQFWNTAGVDATGLATGQSWYYDWTAGAWADGGVMPTALYRTEADIQLNEIYNIGGSTSGFTPTDFNQHYSAGAWQYETPAPAISMDNVVEPWPAAYGGNDHTYLVGGYPGLNTAYEYDPTADTWTTLSTHGFSTIDYPVDGCFGWTDGSGGTDPVIIQFPDTTSAQTNLLVYHIATDTWEEWPVPAGFPANGIWAHDVANDYDRNLCYITGGASVPGGGDLTSFYIYDPVSNTVEQGPDFDSPRAFHSSWYYEDMLCIGGGVDAPGTFLDSTQCAMFVTCPAVEANIEVTAPPLEAELCEDEMATFDFEICNTGDCPLEFWIEEMTGTVKFLGSRPFGAGEPGTMAEAADLDLSAENVEGAASPAANPDAVLWDQPTNLTGAPASQYFPDFDAGLWSADDFENTEWWAIDTIYVPGSLWNGSPQGDLFDAYSLNWFIYADAGDTPPPGVYPDDGSGTEVWSLSLAPDDSAVTISGATNNEATVDIIDAVGGPLYLPPGHYWLAFFPAMDFVPHGQFGWQTSGTMNLASAHFADPAGLIDPLDWTPWGVAINPAYYDAAFRLEGEMRAPPVDVPWVGAMPMDGVLPTGWCMTVEVTLDATDLLPGDYLADLIIHSNDPDTPTTTLPTSLTVLEPVAIADVTYLVDALEVTFDATVTGAPPFTYAWDFGDGNTSDLEDPVHTYADEGCFTVTFTATNECAFDVWSEEVCVEIPFFYYYLPMLYKNG